MLHLIAIWKISVRVGESISKTSSGTWMMSRSEKILKNNCQNNIPGDYNTNLILVMRLFRQVGMNWQTIQDILLAPSQKLKQFQHPVLQFLPFRFTNNC